MQSFRARKFACYVSYSHEKEDREKVSFIVDWLKRAGVPVWFDEQSLPVGEEVVNEFANQMKQCRGFLLFASKASLKSKFVKSEIKFALQEDVRHSAFSLTVVRLDDVNVEKEFPGLASKKWIESQHTQLHADISTLVEINNSIFQRRPSVELGHSTDVYVSRSDKTVSESEEADEICRGLISTPGLRLVGDAIDQPDFSTDRIRRIMLNCSGHLMILPNRQREEDYKYFVRELEQSRSLSIPALVLFPQGSPVPDIIREVSYVELESDGDPTDEVDRFIDDVRATQSTYKPAIFFAHEYKKNLARNHAAMELISGVAGLHCIAGAGITGDVGTQRIVDGISVCCSFLADLGSQLTSEGRLRTHINTCIESGIALGQGYGKPESTRPSDRNIYAVCREPSTDSKTREIPFMLRDLVNIEWYGDDYDFLAKIHKIAWFHRRRIINDEL